MEELFGFSVTNLKWVGVAETRDKEGGGVGERGKGKGRGGRPFEELTEGDNVSRGT